MNNFLDEHADKVAPDPNTGCYHWTGAWEGNGRGKRLSYGMLGKKRAHRLSFESSFGPIPEGMLVRHKCDIPCCVNPDHLELGTSQDNVDDMMDRGRGRYLRATPQIHPTKDGEKQAAERSHHTKLTQDNVDDIRIRRSKGESCSSVGKIYGVSKSQVSKIARGFSWLDGRGGPPR